jgi:hypothetical protein
MILCFEKGRLGNHLFHYCGLQKYLAKHKVIFWGYGHLKNSFENLNGLFIDVNRGYAKNLFKVIKKILLLLAKIKLVGQIKRYNNPKNLKPVFCQGLFFNIYIVHPLMDFQDNDSLKEIVNPPRFKKKIEKLAKSWLKKKNVFADQERLVFVHIRRGDYLYWPSKKFPAVLDLIWYKRKMDKLTKQIKNPIFVLLGDDQNYLHNTFKESSSLIISDNLPEVDLAIMSLCSHGILSASSFAWWASFFAKFRKINKNQSRFIAPKFWFNHKLKKWNYSSIYKTHWITFEK